MSSTLEWLLLLVPLACCLVVDGKPLTWSAMHSIEAQDGGYRITGIHPWMLSDPLAEPIPAERSCLVLELFVSQPVGLQLYWMAEGQPINELRAVRVHAGVAGATETYVAYLDEEGQYSGLNQFRLSVNGPAGTTFSIARVDFVTLAEVEARHLPELIKFRCFTSKLHYLPGERIEYRATLNAMPYPDRQSSKVLDLVLKDASGEVVVTACAQYGLRTGSRYKEVQGVLDTPTLSPGKYTLHGTSTDQRSGFRLEYAHDFIVQGARDPYVCETPFKFVKDFSLVRGPDDRWHVFSITGDLHADHAWSGDGMERTFSHTSSADLRHWTMHCPVLSITDDTHPDGNGRYQDRNIWAPHVIEYDGKYWMFYTSVNTNVSQSVSLATSEDLFEWTPYDANPVFTLEGVEWANWSRSQWGDCRDPCVLVDGDRFYLYATANVQGPGEPGAVVVAESDDLVTWRNPAIAVRGPIVSESPQVWRDGDTYCMLTSAIGAGAYTSKHPMRGWEPAEFQRPHIASFDPLIHPGGSYAEEVVGLPNGEWVLASLTFRHFGNTIYVFRMKTKDGVPVEYESPWNGASEE